MLEWLSALGGIILVDLVLSGDNALVIGTVAAGLPRKQRWMAIVAGGTGAIILRIGFTLLATLLLQVPFVQAIGGAILLYIAIRLLMSRNEKPSSSAHDKKARQAKKGLLTALVTILIADATMSLDNVLAVGALAHGNIPVMVVGLLLSVTLLLIGSAVVSELINRLPWLLNVASLVLAWTAASMLLSDMRLGPLLDHLPWSDFVVPAITITIVVGAAELFYLQERGIALMKK
jgi:YjbE family integral membrane protein